jgi:hypothetical protein
MSSSKAWREMILAPGFEQQPHGALERESDLTSRFPRVSVVDEYPVSRVLRIIFPFVHIRARILMEFTSERTSLP